MKPEQAKVKEVEEFRRPKTKEHSWDSSDTTENSSKIFTLTDTLGANSLKRLTGHLEKEFKI